MAYIYQADIYCDLCGQAIKDDLDKQGKTPSDPSDECSYDSDNYPKHADDDEESDSPQHCGSHEECLNAVTLPSGRKIGVLIGTNLTSEGIRYLNEEIDGGGEVAEFWKEQFSDYALASNVNFKRDFDDFLDDATYEVREMWEKRWGRKLTTEETYALNDLLTSFFADKRRLNRTSEIRSSIP